ncbi:hypothetical protein ElyMa_002076400 [Elysia marginata]|uniref:Uncharacterized protein n=1 Tax=Elysia marginata TaxID=1093978 RepID=A0AAV4FDZ1_9GAST|nr:hypothetical protein ElyMa_002076400 [Elysia marginata]
MTLTSQKDLDLIRDIAENRDERRTFIAEIRRGAAEAVRSDDPTSERLYESLELSMVNCHAGVDNDCLEQRTRTTTGRSTFLISQWCENKRGEERQRDKRTNRQTRK